MISSHFTFKPLHSGACMAFLLMLIHTCLVLPATAAETPSPPVQPQIVPLPRTSKLLQAGLPVRIVLYGDSISEVGRSPRWFGGATSEANNWGAKLKEWLGQKIPNSRFEVSYFAIGGQNTYEGLGRLDWLAQHRPDLVLVAFGANDCAHHFLEPSATQLALESLVKDIRTRYEADVVVVGTAGDNPLKPFFRHLPETLEAQAKAAKVTGALYVDMRKAALKVTENGKLWDKFYLNEGNCHPSDAGHQVWAENAGAVILSALGPEPRR